MNPAQNGAQVRTDLGHGPRSREKAGLERPMEFMEENSRDKLWESLVLDAASGWV